MKGVKGLFVNWRKHSILGFAALIVNFEVQYQKLVSTIQIDLQCALSSEQATAVHKREKIKSNKYNRINYKVYVKE
jgi:hypothetical protein